jgi:hypothetical protein
MFRAHAMCAILYCLVWGMICGTAAGQTNLIPIMQGSEKVISPTGAPGADLRAQAKILG